MTVVVARRPAQQLQCPIGQHFVDVHVGRGAGPALQGVDDDVLVEALAHLWQAVSMAATSRRPRPSS